MRNYRTQDGCHNCGQVFVYKEWEQGDRLYCTEGAQPRPLCDSVYMGEWRQMQDPSEHGVWGRWAEGREVQREGVCDAWTPVASANNPE